MLQKIRDGLETQASCDWFPRRAELHSFVGGPSRLLALGRSSWFCCRLSGCPCVSHRVRVCSVQHNREERSPVLTRPEGVKLCLGCCADVQRPSCSAVLLRLRCSRGWILSRPQGAELINAPVSVECGHTSGPPLCMRRVESLSQSWKGPGRNPGVLIPQDPCFGHAG